MPPAPSPQSDDQDRLTGLCEALLRCQSAEEAARFLRDLCTPKEVRDLSERWALARMLDAGQMSYRQIAEATGASTTTIGRVARFLREEPHQGYRLILDRTPPLPDPLSASPASAPQKPTESP